MEREWPFLGRTHEVGLLTEVIRSGERSGIVLAGAAGVGKTRLAVECVAAAERTGMVTFRALATRSATHIPFGALAQLLPASDDRGSPLRACADAIAARAGDRPALVFVDDAHLLDDPSAALTHQLAATGVAFVVATVRTGERAPDAVAALWKDELAERVDVRQLDSATIEALVATVLGGPVDAAAMRALAVRSEGNVLFLRELLLSAQASGSLVNERGTWFLRGPLHPSDRLVELVEARLGDLGDAERDLLEVVAVGQPLGVDELALLTDPSTADALERKVILRSTPDEVRLAHPLYGEVVRSRIPVLGLRSIHRRLADAIEATGAERPEDLLRLATWRLDGGGRVNPELTLGAGYQARYRGDFPLAERLARAAASAGAGFDAVNLIGHVLWLQGRFEDTDQHLDGIDTTDLTDHQRAGLAVLRMGNLLMGLGRIEDTLRVGAEAEASITDPNERDTITITRAYMLLVSGQAASAFELAEPLLSRPPGPILAFASSVAERFLVLTGRLSEAIAVSERGYQAHTATRDHTNVLSDMSSPYLHLGYRCDAYVCAGRLQEAEAFATAQHERLVAEESADSQAFMVCHLARTHLAQGRIEDAIRVAHQSATQYRGLGWSPLLRLPLIVLAHAHAVHGSVDEATAVLAELDGLGARGAEVLQARAWTSVAAGDLPTAREHLHAAADRAKAKREFVVEAAALHDLARLGHHRQVSARLTELATIVEGSLMRCRAEHGAALVTQDPAALAAASDGFEELGAILLAAEAATDAAVAFRRAGASRQAAAAERRAGALAARCQGATTPALRSIDTRVLLSPAESDIAVLAAAGHRNKEIAEQLVLSVRTVENNLHRVYEKLGISGRSDLRDAMDQL